MWEGVCEGTQEELKVRERGGSIKFSTKMRFKENYTVHLF